MLGAPLRERITAAEFHPFTLVLANGERVPIRHRDSITHPSIEVRGARFYHPWVIVLETKDDKVIDRIISLAMIAQIVDELDLNGFSGPNGHAGSDGH